LNDGDEHEALLVGARASARDDRTLRGGHGSAQHQATKAHLRSRADAGEASTDPGRGTVTELLCKGSVPSTLLDGLVHVRPLRAKRPMIDNPTTPPAVRDRRAVLSTFVPLWSTPPPA
jgi:hypothetical protein